MFNNQAIVGNDSQFDKKKEPEKRQRDVYKAITSFALIHSL